MLTSALAAVSNLHFFDDHHHFITHSSCHYSPLTHFIIRSRTYAWRVWYGGGVGGWVGGIMTFVTTTGHIVSVDDHHHFITHSSCHYSPLTHFIIRSRTYAWRVWYGGGVGVGGGDSDVRYILNLWTTLCCNSLNLWRSRTESELLVLKKKVNRSQLVHRPWTVHGRTWKNMFRQNCMPKTIRQILSMEIFGNTYTPGSGAAIAAWIFGKAFLTCSMPKKGLASSGPRLINWTVIPDSWTYFSLMMNYDWDYQKHHRRYSGRDLVYRTNLQWVCCTEYLLCVIFTDL